MKKEYKKFGECAYFPVLVLPEVEYRFERCWSLDSVPLRVAAIFFVFVRLEVSNWLDTYDIVVCKGQNHPSPTSLEISYPTI